MKIKLPFSLVFFFFCVSSYSQINFEENIITDVQQNINGMAVAMAKDLDSDGDLDLIYSSTVDKIIWLKNTDGLGTFEFQNAINLTDPSSPEYDSYEKIFDIADLDSDGDLDILTKTSDASKIEWIENLDGLGNSWQEHNISTGTGTCTTIKAIDMDNDGDIDVLAGTLTTGLIWHENLDGLGSFDSAYHLIGTGYSNAISAKDLNGDGYFDLITNSDLGLVWYENLDGLGNFSPANNISTNLSQDIISVDLDGDNDNDIAILNYIEYSQSNTITWYENLNGLGNFSTEQVITTSATSNKSISYLDMDSDGDFDIIAGLIWYENTDGQGAFTVNNNIPVDYVSNDYVVDLLFVDLNNDGLDDAINTTSIHNEYGWFQNNDGNFNFQFLETNSFLFINKIKPADIDGDLDNDIFLYSYYDGKIGWYKNLDSQGNFSELILIDNIITNTSFYDMSISDVDSDGDKDLIINYNYTVSWYENMDGLGNFGDEQVIVNDNIYDFISADIDSDGDDDIIYVDKSTTTADDIIKFMANDGLGNFSDPVNIIQDSSSFLIAEDIDNDNDLDLVYTGFYMGGERQISWLENLDGLGNFGAENVITSNFLVPRYVSIEDIDYDGDFDIIATDNSGRIRMLKNLDGHGSFGNAQTIQNGGANFVIEDIDGDGYKDLVYYRVTSNTGLIKWKKNLFGTGFGNTVTINQIDKTPVDLVDFDGDGNLDILYTDRNDRSEFGWLKNLGLENNEINGRVRLDLDTNGCDVADQDLSKVLVTTTDDQNNSLGAFTYLNGFYQLGPGIGSYNTSVSSELLNYFNISPLSQNTVFDSTGNTETIDFCLEPANNFTDLNVAVYPSQEDPRPGFDTSYIIVVNNVGATITSGAVVFEYDDEKLNFLNASEPVSSQTSNSLTFDFVDLNHFSTLIFHLQFNVFEPPLVNSGNILNSTTSVVPLYEDNTENDNTFNLTQTVVNSFDPNDIRVLEGNEISYEDADKYLHYIIRFQNNGTASAINIVVNNPIDVKLDWTTLQLEDLSHNGIVKITNGANLSFKFENINLPDSTTDEPNSHGYLAYKIKPKNDVIIGDIFNNRASIIFDFNEPIITNTVNTEIIETLSLMKNELNNILVYPNPTTNILHVETNNTITSIEVYNLLGQELISSTPNTLKEEINMSELNTGMYLVKVTIGEQTATYKVVKQ